MSRGQDDPTPSRARRDLGLGLTNYEQTLTTRLLLHTYTPPGTGDRDWLRRRYDEIVPVVLADALAAVDCGASLQESTLALLRRHARECHDPVSVSTVLRGSVPALQVFGDVLHLVVRAEPSKAFVAMARASAVATELGSCWAEAWYAARHADSGGSHDGEMPEAAGAVGAVGPDTLATAGPIVAVDLDQADAQMLVLAATGSSNAEIAEQTHYSRQAVTWRLSRLMKRWNARNRAALIATGFSRGALEVRQNGVGELPRVDGERPDAAIRTDPETQGS